MKRRSLISHTHVDGVPAVMRLDPISRHATVMWDGYLHPAGPHHKTAHVPGVTADVPGFTCRLGRVVALPPPLPPPKPPGRLAKLFRRR
ncbi:MAG: hypothetical protein ACR2HR_09130 [Euzebya sp.]